MNQAFQENIRLHHLGVIAVTGDDAKRFLHTQLTNDFINWEPSQARLAAHCSAQGRMTASFVAVQDSPTHVLLVCSRDLLTASMERLRRFVLRAKVSLRDASDEFVLWGQIRRQAMGSAVAHLPWKVAFNDANRIGIALPSETGIEQSLWIHPSMQTLDGTPSDLIKHWWWHQISAGFLLVNEKIADRFIPQMLNYESIDGVHFHKGCYPGQEVIARAQFRGSVKRKMFIAEISTALALDEPIFSDAAPGTECGATLTASVASPDASVHRALICMNTAHAPGNLTASSSNGSRLSLQPLPYTLLTDI